VLGLALEAIHEYCVVRRSVTSGAHRAGPPDGLTVIGFNDRASEVAGVQDEPVTHPTAVLVGGCSRARPLAGEWGGNGSQLAERLQKSESEGDWRGKASETLAEEWGGVVRQLSYGRRVK
jgi:hypothetical protein